MSSLPPAPVTRTYHAYGLTIASDVPFANLRPAAARTPPDLTFTVVAEPPLAVVWQEHAAEHTARYYLPDGTPLCTLYRLPDGCEVLRFARVADFYLWPSRIVCHLLDPAHLLLAELRLLGTVIACWAERRGIAMLHASAVVTARGAVGFLATSGAGKSSLAATFVHAGHPLLTDDLLPIRRVGETWMGAPGYPQMRMWPEVAVRFLERVSDLSPVHPDESKLRVPIGAHGFGSFCVCARPLVALYLPRRRDPATHGTAIDVVPLSPTEAVFTLIEHSFAAALIHGLPSQRERLRLLAPLARQLPIWRLLYPSGYEHLSRVRQAILDDLARSLPARARDVQADDARG